MAKGLPKSIIAKYGITKKAWQVFRGTRRKTSNPKHKYQIWRIKKRGGKIRTMARRYFRRRRSRGSMTIPLAPIGGIVGALAPAIERAMQGRLTGNDSAIDWAVYRMTGYSMNRNQWEWEGLVAGLTPIVAGLLVHKFVGGRPLNLNQTLAKAKVPFIRI